MPYEAFVNRLIVANESFVCNVHDENGQLRWCYSSGKIFNFKLSHASLNKGIRDFEEMQTVYEELCEIDLFSDEYKPLTQTISTIPVKENNF